MTTITVMNLIVVLALLVGAISAIRGVWSPCGLSMLSSITPMTEAGRGHRFSYTASWFMVGGVVGGLSIGALAGIIAAAIDASGLSETTLLGVGAGVAVITAMIDLGVGGVSLPIFKRQVNDAWLRRYRPWVYGAGFGWQIGFGLATYIMTAGVILTVALAALSASPVAAVAIGGFFGLVRGSAVWIGRSGKTPQALGQIHDRLDSLAPVSRAGAAAIQVFAAVALGAACTGLMGAGVVALVLALCYGLQSALHRSPASI